VNEQHRSRRVIRASTVLVPGFLAAILFLAGEGRSPRTPSSLAERAARAFTEQDRDLSLSLERAAFEPDRLVLPEEQRAEVFDHLAALMEGFPPGTSLEPVSYTHLRAHET